MRYETEKALIAGIGQYISVSRGRPVADNSSTFDEDLVRPLWDAGLVGGPDLDSLKTTPAGLAAIMSV